MAKPVPRLKNAPITEAVIEITVQFSEPRAPEQFSEIRQFIGAEYPHEEPRRLFQWRIEGGGIDHQESSIMGYLYRSADGTAAVQSKPDGMAFSRLKPYQDWDSTLTEAWKLWRLYSAHFKPARVKRLATRFINQLSLPGPQVDFDDYLLIAPKLPEGAPNTLAAFSSAVSLPTLAPSTLGIVRTTFPAAAAPVGDTIPVTLDIDIIRECDLDPSDNAAILNALQDLRPIKNRLFFGSLTDKAVELFA